MLRYDLNKATNTHEIKGLENATCQFQNTISMPDTLEEHVILQDENKKGDFLFSNAFGPCIAVLVQLKDGNSIVFHATTPFPENQPFKDFIKTVQNEKNNVADIFVFEKGSNHSNQMRSPLLTVALSDALHCEVKRVKVDHYTAIIADAKNKKIILANEINFESKADYDKNKNVDLKSAKIVDLNKAIGLEDSVATLLESQRKGNLVHYTIPMRFLTKINQIERIINEEIEVLKKKSASLFQSYNATDKVTMIQDALKKAIVEYKGKVNTLEDAKKFLAFKTSSGSSIEEALNFKRLAQSHMYARIVEVIEKEFLAEEKAAKKASNKT